MTSPDQGPDPLHPDQQLLVESPEAARARRMRNLMLAGVLVVFVAIVFTVTIIRLGGHAFQ